MPMTYTFGGKTLTLREWAAELAVTEAALRQRIANGLPVERVLAPAASIGRYTNRLNERYGTLTVVGFAGRHPGRGYLWKCRCDCGRTITVPAKRLKNLTVCGRRHDPERIAAKYPHNQPCWSCENYVDGCVWARTRTQPVAGWVAEPTIKSNGKLAPARSYAIHYCPEYRPDGTEGRLDE